MLCDHVLTGRRMKKWLEDPKNAEVYYKYKGIKEAYSKLKPKFSLSGQNLHSGGGSFFEVKNGCEKFELAIRCSSRHG